MLIVVVRYREEDVRFCFFSCFDYDIFFFRGYNLGNSFSLEEN